MVLKWVARRADANGEGAVTFLSEDGAVRVSLTFAQWKEMDFTTEVLIAAIPWEPR